jgi:hypothetical protein
MGGANGIHAEKKKKKNSSSILVRKPQVKRLRGRPTHRWDENNEMDFEEKELDANGSDSFDAG